jgi:DNA-binding beta-propeller fold protein YncE
VLRYDGKSGRFLGAFVLPGSGGLDFPKGLAFGPDGSLYVNGFFSFNVLRYDGATGAFLDAFVPRTTGGLIWPDAGLAFGPDGNLYVSEGDESGSVKRFDGTTGAFIDTFIPAGSGGLTYPSYLMFRSSNARSGTPTAAASPSGR